MEIDSIPADFFTVPGLVFGKLVSPGTFAYGLGIALLGRRWWHFVLGLFFIVAIEEALYAYSYEYYYPPFWFLLADIIAGLFWIGLGYCLTALWRARRKRSKRIG
ncbi:MAG: hypothetical protein AB7O39_11910 [Flavobacteriaceae bacterium]